MSEVTPKRFSIADIAGSAFILLLLGAIVAGLIILFSALNASDGTLPTRIGNAVGEMEAGHASSQMYDEAALRHRLSLAEAEIARMDRGYEAFYSAVRVAGERASEWEGNLISAQMRAREHNNIGETIGANILSIGCIGALLTPDDPQAEAMCEASRELDRGMVEDFSDLPQYRPSYIEDVLDSFPRPGNFMSSEYRRVRNEFPRAYEPQEEGELVLATE